MKLVDWVFAKLHKITDDTFVVRIQTALNERIKKPYNVMFEGDQYLVEILSEDCNEQSLGIRFCLKNTQTGVTERPIFSFTFDDHTSVEGNMEEFEHFIFTHAAVASLPPGDPDRLSVQVKAPAEREQTDLDSTNLDVGKIIEDNSIKCEITAYLGDDYTEYGGNNLRIKILEIYWNRLGTYLDIGQTYPLRIVYQSENRDMITWEIPEQYMKRSTSQVLLQWEKGVGWTWDLDM